MKRLSFFVLAGILVFTMPLLSYAGVQKVLKIDFKTPVSEQGNTSFSLASFSLDDLMSGNISLLRMVRAIDAAAADPSISMIYMTPDNFSAGISQMEEVRSALARFRASGKSIVAYCENLSNASYYVASVADKIVLNPASENYLTGLATQQIFLKDALDALGVEVQLIRHGKYKSAGEMFTRNDFSPENLEQNQVMVNSLWNGMSSEMAASRNIPVESLNAWIDSLSLVSAESFKQRGLVDELWHKDELDDYLSEQAGLPVVRMVPFVSISKYMDKVEKKLRKQTKRCKEKIAVVYANGEIVASTDGTGMAEDVIVGKSLAATLEKVRKDDKIKAVVLRVNSPGGSVFASELIKREMDLLAASKLVVASYGDYAASGGYWISAGAKVIFTDKATLTGSIGCFSMIPAVGNAVHKIAKVNIATVGSSKHSDMLTGMRHLDDTETAFMQAQIESIYDKFTTIVSDGRGLSKDSVDAIGQGRVWTGSDAVGIGLADRVGGLADAIAYAAEQVCPEMYALVEYPEVKPFSWLSLFGEDVDLDETLTSDAQVSSMFHRLLPFVPMMRKSQSPVNMARMTEVYSFD